MRAAIALLAAPLLAAASDPAPPARSIDGFDDAPARGVPAGWRIDSRTGGDPGVAVTGVADGAGRHLHLAATTLRAGQATRLQRSIDATPWRGRLVRLSARVRVAAPGSFVGLFLDVRRPKPWENGFRDTMYDRPIGAGDWRPVAITGHVDSDALTIDLGVSMGGEVALDLDDVALADVTPDPAAPSAEAAAYLDAAMDHLQKMHIRAAEMDWAAIRARAQAEIGGAKTPADTYGAIRGVLGTLGDNHAALIPPRPRPTTSASGSPPPAFVPPRPSYRLVDGRFGVVTLPALNMMSAADVPHAKAYIATLREGLRAFDVRPLCGWIVDLRSNTGGNMWPMLNGLTPLLGAPPFGHFVEPDGATTPWILTGGIVAIEGYVERGLGITPWRLRQARLPVAVLIGSRTSSSGEAVAIAFSGRAGTRSFGQPSGGYTTANQGRTLPDGATLLIPSGWERDRNGRDFREKIMPDEVTAPGGELAAARAWLAATCAG